MSAKQKSRRLSLSRASNERRENKNRKNLKDYVHDYMVTQRELITNNKR